MRSSSNRPASQRLPRRMGLLAACLLPLALTGCEKWRLDAEVARLCAKDGGIKVYETVKLPADQFDQWGMVKFYRPTQGESALGPTYVFRWETTYYRQGNPQMTRDHIAIARRSDGKLLGESIFYGRGGGDLPGPWHESHFRCPDPREGEPNTLLKQVFIPVSSNEGKS